MKKRFDNEEITALVRMGLSNRDIEAMHPVLLEMDLGFNIAEFLRLTAEEKEKNGKTDKTFISYDRNEFLKAHGSRHTLFVAPYLLDHFLKAGATLIPAELSFDRFMNTLPHDASGRFSMKDLDWRGQTWMAEVSLPGKECFRKAMKLASQGLPASVDGIESALQVIEWISDMVLRQGCSTIFPKWEKLLDEARSVLMLKGKEYKSMVEKSYEIDSYFTQLDDFGHTYYRNYHPGSEADNPGLDKMSKMSEILFVCATANLSKEELDRELCHGDMLGFQYGDEFIQGVVNCDSITLKHDPELVTIPEWDMIETVREGYEELIRQWLIVKRIKDSRPAMLEAAAKSRKKIVGIVERYMAGEISPLVMKLMVDDAISVYYGDISIECGLFGVTDLAREIHGWEGEPFGIHSFFGHIYAEDD